MSSSTQMPFWQFRRTVDVLRQRKALLKVTLDVFTEEHTCNSFGSKCGRFLSQIIQDRKIVPLFLVHFVITMLVWQHHFYEKFRVKYDTIPPATNRYWGKLWVPTWEFGAMHAILLQMALLPLTMCRHLVVQLSQSIFQRIFPFERTISMHVHLGYTMCIIVFGATVVFFGFFGTLCRDEWNGREPMKNGHKIFCDKLSSEIMLTGLGIFSILMVVLFTSYYRSKIPYEVFYFAHHLVFVMFALAVAHTMDDKNRAGQERSQTFQWFCASLALYFTDRMYMTLVGFKAEAMVAQALGHGEAGRVVLLRLQKPAAFLFQPGQYAYLKIPGVDPTWHPFAIASSTLEETLDFFIEVHAEGSWTEKLWSRLHNTKSARDLEKAAPGISVQVMGPYGAGIADMTAHRNLVLIGAGTGVVPMMSALKTVYMKLCCIDAEAHRKVRATVRTVGKEVCREIKKTAWRRSAFAVLRCMFLGASANNGDDEKGRSSFTNTVLNEMSPAARSRFVLLVTRAQLRFRTNAVKTLNSPTYKALLRRKNRAMILEYLKLSLLLLPPLECCVSGLALSWKSVASNDGVWITTGMKLGLFHLSWLALASFFVFWLFTEILCIVWLLDLAVVVATLAAYSLWHRREFWDEGFNEWQLAAISALAFYRMSRVWWVAVATEQSPLQKFMAQKQKAVLISPVDSVKLVYTSRDSALPSFVWNDLEKLWARLGEKYGKYASGVSGIEVYITGENKERFEFLRSKVEETELYRSGALRFGRPDFARVLVDRVCETIEGLEDDYNGAASSTLVAYCGGQELGAVIHRHVINLVSASKALMGGGSNHHVQFYEASYPVPSKKVKRTTVPVTETFQQHNNMFYDKQESAFLDMRSSQESLESLNMKDKEDRPIPLLPLQNVLSHKRDTNLLPRISLEHGDISLEEDSRAYKDDSLPRYIELNFEQDGSEAFHVEDAAMGFRAM